MATADKEVAGGDQGLRAANRLLKALRSNKLAENAERRNVSSNLHKFPIPVLAAALPRIAEIAAWEKDPHVQTDLILAIGVSGRSVKTAPAAIRALNSLKRHTVDDTARLDIMDAIAELRLLTQVMCVRGTSPAKLSHSSQPAA